MTANNDVEYSKYGTYDAVVGDKLVKNVYFKTILVSNQTETSKQGLTLKSLI